MKLWFTWIYPLKIVIFHSYVTVKPRGNSLKNGKWWFSANCDCLPEGGTSSFCSYLTWNCRPKKLRIGGQSTLESVWSVWSVCLFEKRPTMKGPSIHMATRFISHRIHGAGIYANKKGVYWWDPCYHIHGSYGYGWWHDPSPFQDSHLGTRSELRHHILCNASGPWARSTCSIFFGPLGQSRNGNMNFKKQRFSHHGMSLSVRFHAVPWTSFYFLLSFLFIHRHDLFPMARSSSAQNLFSPGADLCLDRLARGYQRRFKRPYQNAQKHSWNIGKVLKHGVKYQFCGSIGVSRSTLCELIFSWDNLGSYSVLQQGQRWHWISQTHKLHW